MAKIKENLTDLTTDELIAKIKEEKLKYKKMKFSHAISSMENPMQLRVLRRQIAGMLTEMRKRQLTK
jgi:large subunit ribosomal protein L29